jgi:hypothetical protein
MLRLGIEEQMNFYETFVLKKRLAFITNELSKKFPGQALMPL